jgi:phospho-N-acetylmuramoyl-pentapeptide-transferase
MLSWLTANLETLASRTAAAVVLSFLLMLLLGRRGIAWLADRFREPIKGDSARLCQLHRTKEATPTMGGLFIVAAMISVVVLLADPTNAFVMLALGVTVSLSVLGAFDDLAKIRRPGNGLRARTKLWIQLAIAGVAAVLLYSIHAQRPDGLLLAVPGLAWQIPLGVSFIPLAVVVIVGSANAVNLSDGLDGLAGGCLLVAGGAMGAVVYACAHAGWAPYLGLFPVGDAAEMVVVAGAMVGAVLGFLWFNCHPAQVFMGDTGSLALGGLLAMLALAVRQELLLAIIGGVFVAEALSVVLQVGYYKWRRRRIFLCAPLHHHYQFRGWPETRVVTRFWIAGVLCAALGLALVGSGTRFTSGETRTALQVPAAEVPHVRR